MGTLYFIVNLTRKEYIDSICKKEELPLDTNVMRTLIDLLDCEWDSDKIRIISERQLTEEEDYKNFKPIKVEKEE